MSRLIPLRLAALLGTGLIACHAYAADLFAPGGTAINTLADKQLNSSSSAATNLLDDNTSTRWLSDRRDNDLIFAFDASSTERCFGQFTLQNHGSNRSIRQFVLLYTLDASLSTDTGTIGWTPIVAQANPVGPANHVHWGQGGRLTAHDKQLNSSTWAAAHINNGNLGDYWLSDKGNNTLDFAFDTDWDGSAGNTVDISQFALHNYGGSRSIRQFQVEVSQDGTTWEKLEVPGSNVGDPDFNFASAQEGARLDAINRELNSTSWAAANIHDGASQSIWLSDRTNNNLDFSFDPDGDGVTGLTGDAGDRFTLEKIAMQNEGSTRSVREFQILVKTATNPAWTALPVPGSTAGQPDFNFAQSHNGGTLTAINRELNSSSWAAANIHDGSTQTIWLSDQANNNLDFVFDGNDDGSTGTAGDQFTLQKIAFENYGSARSLKDFQIEVQTATVPTWTKLPVPGSAAGDSGFNFLSRHEGGVLTSVNSQVNTTSWAGVNLIDGSPLSIWLSSNPTNTLQFAFDTDLNGSTGDAVNFSTLRMQNYGSARSVATFEVDVQIGGGAWQPVLAPGGGTVFSATQGSAPQTWSVATQTNVTAFRLRTLSNFGDAYTGIRELELLGDAVGPSHTFSAAQAAAEQVISLAPAAQPTQVTAVRLRAINNYGDTYVGVREFKVLGDSIVRNQTFVAQQSATEQVFVIDPADRPADVTAVRLQTISNYGDAGYIGVRELRLLGPSVVASHTFEASDTSTRQLFTLDLDDVATGVVAARLRTVSNHGDGSYIGAREFELLGDPVGPSYVFTANQAATSQSWNFPSVTARLFRLHTADNYGDAYTGAAEIGLETAADCDPLAVWYMNELNWGSVTDSSGNGNQGTAFNGARTAYDYPIVPNSPGTCRHGSFDGTDDYVSLPTFPNLSGSFTIAAWIRPNELGNDQRIFADDRNNSGGFAFSLGDGGAGRLRFFSRAVQPVILDSPAVITQGAWHFVAVVHDAPNKTRKIYVDGGLTPVAQDTYTNNWGIDNGPASIGGEVDGTSEATSRWRFNGAIDEFSVYQRPLSGGALAILKDKTQVCGTLIVVDEPAFAFNCIEPGDDAITGRLHTKAAGSSFVLDIAALRDGDGDNVADGIDTQYAQTTDRTINVELVDSSSGGSCPALPALTPALSAPVTFRAADGGRAQSPMFAVARAYPAVACRVTDANDSPAVVGCSTDSFSVRPTAFALQPAALNNAGASGAPALEVGAAFSLSVSAGPGYEGTPVVVASPIEAHAGAVAIGNLGGGFGSADAATGIATGTTFSYSEVGNFRFLANAIRDAGFTAVDQPGDCIPGSLANAPDGNGRIGCDFANPAATAWVGRFTPDHFDVVVSEPGALANTCTGFSYAGTGIGYSIVPELLITARAGDGSPTRNYTGAYNKLAPAEVSLSTLSGDATTLGADGATPVTVSMVPGAPTLLDNGDGTLSLTLVDDAFTYGRTLNDQVGEFVSDVTRALTAVTDTEDGTTAAGLPLNLSPVGVPIRYGRLNIDAAYGSELQTLPVPMRVEYFAGASNRFQPNLADTCTTINTVAITDADTGDALLPGATCIWDAAGASGAFACGAPGVAADQYRASPIGADFNLNLMAPNGGATGILRMTADAPAWLEFDWQGAGVQDPSATATFGRFRGHDRIIFWSEVK